jgi:hypothetical protein
MDLFKKDTGQELYKLIRYQAFMGADILKGIALLIIYLRRKYFNTKINANLICLF